jgi:putative restriction endonuclease
VRAPHKPLLVLYALGRWSGGDEADIPFKDIDRDLTPLLKEFGPPRQSYHPEYPFWRLQNDGVWQVTSTGPLKRRQGNTDPPKSELLAHDARGGFTDEMKAALRSDPALPAVIATRLLDNHFPESLHPDILDAVGLAVGPAWRKAVHGRRRSATGRATRIQLWFDKPGRVSPGTLLTRRRRR